MADLEESEEGGVRVPRPGRELHVDIKRAIAEGTHSLIRTSPDDRGTSAADIFGLAEGKVIERWDVLQPVPETAANDNTML